MPTVGPSKTEKVKKLLKERKFDEIEQKYGAKTLQKGIQYAKKKQLIDDDTFHKIMKRIQGKDRPAEAAPLVSSLGLAKRVTTKADTLASNVSNDCSLTQPAVQQTTLQPSQQTNMDEDASIVQSQLSVNSSRVDAVSDSQSQPLLQNPASTKPKSIIKPGPLLAASIRKGTISIGVKSTKKVRASAGGVKLGVKKHKLQKSSKRASYSATAGDSSDSDDDAAVSAFGRRHFLHVEKEEEYSMQSLPLGDKGEPLWLNQETMLPRQRTMMDYSKYETDIGCRMCLIVPAYEEFMMNYAEEFESAEQMELALSELSLLKDRADADCTVRVLVEATSSIDGMEADWTAVVLNVVPSQDADSEDIALDGTTITVMSLPAQSVLMTLPSFLVKEDIYDQMMARAWAPGRQVTVRFPAPSEADPLAAEVYEGRIYHVGPSFKKEDYKRTAYKSLHVVWYEQEVVTRKWRIDYQQTDNQLSPWEVDDGVSSFVRPENIDLYVLPPPFLSTAKEVISYLRQSEAGQQFKVPVSRRCNPDYYRKVREPLDLSTMSAREKAGEYKHSKGVAKLWSDLKQMVKNAKSYNAAERFEWRCADMLEREARRLKARFGKDPGDAASIEDTQPLSQSQPAD